jgi:hypothetical protein
MNLLVRHCCARLLIESLSITPELAITRLLLSGIRPVNP